MHYATHVANVKAFNETCTEVVTAHVSNSQFPDYDHKLYAFSAKVYS